MNQLTMENLERCFTKAKELNMEYVGVLIRMKGFEKDEIIINPKENFDGKLAYYMNAYDLDLEHRHAEGISIVGFAYGNNFAWIEKDLLR